VPSEPVRRVLEKLRNVRPSGKGWSAICPAHDDQHNSLSIHEGPDGRALLHCFAACEITEIVKAIGLELRDLFAAGTARSLHRGPRSNAGRILSVGDLAKDKGLPLEFLRELGLRDRSDGVLIPYLLRDGAPAPRQRLRTARSAKEGSVWLPGEGHPVPYGLSRLHEAEAVGHITLVEGESDAWTAWFHGQPALGLPGANMAHLLQRAHLKDIRWMYVLKEPDRGGEAFVAGIMKRCRETDWKGLLFVVVLPNGVKDLNDLHRLDPDQFKPVFEAVITEATPVDLATPEVRVEAVDEGSEKDEKATQTDTLLALVADLELFHDADGEAYTTFVSNLHAENWRIRTRAFRRFLVGKYYKSESRAPNSQAVQSALDLLEARAAFDAPERQVHVRLAEHAGSIYLDLANTQWEVVEIAPSGWRILPTSPVKFLRTRGMATLPYPTPGGSLVDLRPFLNVATDDDFRLIVAWLVAALRPRGPYPVLALHGEHGTAKSSVAKVGRALCDPNRAPLRAEPSDVRDMMITASKSWCQNLDNVSHLPPWLSDAICRLATGGGFSTRQLYLDDEEIIFDAQRPVVINGIEELATRGDLLDRCLVLHLPEIPPEGRREEEEFWSEFEKARPRILGALLDAVSAALRNLPDVVLPEKPRMADFAVWVTAAEEGLGWPAGAFLRAYTGNRDAANEVVLEASPVAALIMAIDSFEGTAAELLKLLNERIDEGGRRHQGWPKGPRMLAGALKRIAPNLRVAGIQVQFTREPTAKRRRLIRLTKVPDTTVQTVHTVQNSHPAAQGLDDVDATPLPSGRSGSPEEAEDHTVLDGPDDVDGRTPSSYDDVR